MGFDYGTNPDLDIPACQRIGRSLSKDQLSEVIRGAFMKGTVSLDEDLWADIDGPDLGSDGPTGA